MPLSSALANRAARSTLLSAPPLPPAPSTPSTPHLVFCARAEKKMLYYNVLNVPRSSDPATIRKA